MLNIGCHQNRDWDVGTGTWGRMCGDARTRGCEIVDAGMQDWGRKKMK